jgi:hypothetical protein
MASQPASTSPKQLVPYQWPKGVSGNPKGRAPGSKQKLGEDFVGDLLEHWQENGAAAIAGVFATDKVAYLNVIARVIPKEVIHTAGGYDDLSDDDLGRLFIELALRAAGIEPGGVGVGTQALPPPFTDEPPLAAGSRSGSEGL